MKILSRMAICLAMAAVGAVAQLTATFAGAAAVSHTGLGTSPVAGGAGLGIALTPLSPKVELDWNFANVEAIRTQGQFGGAAATNLQGWFSPTSQLQHRGGELMAEAGLGKQWGGGLSGFKQWGLGAGWRVGTLVPFVEYRDRTAFHAGRGNVHEVVAGIHWVLWD